jgi:antirestriction protein ArdC
MTTTTARRDIYGAITDRIIAQLEQGVRPWVKPWSAMHTDGRITRPLRHNGMPYRGINILLLWIEAVSSGYEAPSWMTYKQAAGIGAQVRKGAHGTMIVYADRFTRTESADNGEQVERAIPFLKSYTVFNVAQINGLPAHYHAAAAPREPLAVNASAEAFFAAVGADIKPHPDKAAYARVPHDFIWMPPREAFHTVEAYYDTLGHEHVHWTAHPQRLDRDLAGRFGTESYAAEELVAEMGAAFLCADLGISAEVRPDHAAYLATWLKLLRDDKRAIVTAAAHAQRALDYLHGLQPGAGPVDLEAQA